ncbi:hypothetical protein HPP92_016892 [Vanilla planifolia]|uniref:BHLH domain-containing protein n=1 Tax=Vanilla planifolia TaxID=51239 RepID=A0A835UUM3_VANPL|nr:hypothetical protein HPP92_016892 [Vanilla planifolia]
MLSTIPSWTDLVKSPWDLANSTAGGKTLACENGLHFASPFDESSLLAARLRQHQISGDTPAVKQLMLPISAQQHQQLFLSAMSGRPPPPPSANASAVEAGGLLPLLSPLVAEEIFNGFGGGSIHRSENQQQHFHQPQNASMPQQSYGGTPSPATASTAGTSITSGGGGGNSQVAPPRQRVRARRGQATDPHSIAERLRRERIADRMKALQELVPNANKTDKASMLDEIIDYVKFLQLQVKVLSMSRLGGAGAVAPLVADISSEGGSAGGRGALAASEAMTATEQQVAKLMEEDMGSAMQYLQGKGLCLMPISLASAISTATFRGPSAGATVGLNGGGNSNSAGMLMAGGDAPSSPSLSVLTVQSAVAGGGADTDVSRSSGKDAASVSKS